MKKPTLDPIVTEALEVGYTFPSSRGELNICQVMQLSLNSLEEVGKNLYNEAKEAGFSLTGLNNIKTPQKKLDIIQAVADYKIAMQEYNLEKQVEREEAKQLQELLIQAKMEKQVEELKTLTPKQIKKKLKELQTKLGG